MTRYRTILDRKAEGFPITMASKIAEGVPSCVQRLAHQAGRRSNPGRATGAEL